MHARGIANLDTRSLSLALDSPFFDAFFSLPARAVERLVQSQSSFWNRKKLATGQALFGTYPFPPPLPLSFATMPSIAIQVPYQAQPGMKIKAKLADGRSFLITIPGQCIE